MMNAEPNASPIILSRMGRREAALRLRFERGWPLTKIARRLGVGKPAVCRLLRRASPGLAAAAGVRSRNIRPKSLSGLVHV